MTSEENEAAVNAYLYAFYRGDFATAKSFVAEAFRFTGPFTQSQSRDAFFASADGLASIVKGHRLAHQWSDRDEVCSVFEMKLETPMKKGAILVCEWHTLAERQLIAGRVMLDVMDFRAFLPAR